MKTIAPLQVLNLVKSFTIFFLVTSLGWIASNYVIFRTFYIGWPILLGNVIITAVLGWWWYKRSYHSIFSYDQQGFEVQRGKARKESKKWGDFSQVSLVHEEYGRFVVRLYENDKKYTVIPASDLKLDASDFRFEVTELVRGKSAGEGTRNAGKES